MKNKLVIALLATSLCAGFRRLQAESPVTNPLLHPITAFDEHEIKVDTADLQRDERNITEMTQRLKAKQDFRDQQKSLYEQSLKSHGAQSPITQQALIYSQDAQKRVERGVHQLKKANDAKVDDQKELDFSQASLNAEHKTSLE